MTEPSAKPPVDAAVRQLRLGSTNERIAAARYLEDLATLSDVSTLETARRRELDHYVRRAIDDAIEAATGRPHRPDSAPPTHAALDPDTWGDDTYASALRAATSSLVHELRMPLGLASVALDRGDSAAVQTQLDRMDALLDAMEMLVAVSSGGQVTSVALKTLADSVATEAEVQLGVPVRVIADHDTLVSAYLPAVELILRNAVKNACESTQKRGGKMKPIVIDFGRTDRDAWIVVVDHGAGLAPGFDPFAFAASRKDDHLGVGLALAKQAARILGGQIELTQRDDGGVTFRLDWLQTE